MTFLRLRDRFKVQFDESDSAFWGVLLLFYDLFLKSLRSFSRGFSWLVRELFYLRRLYEYFLAGIRYVVLRRHRLIHYFRLAMYNVIPPLGGTSIVSSSILSFIDGFWLILYLGHFCVFFFNFILFFCEIFLLLFFVI